MPRFNEFETVRLTQDVSGTCDLGLGPVRLSAGARGVIADLLGGRGAYLVEFELEPPRFSESGEVLSTGERRFLTLSEEQIERAHKETSLCFPSPELFRF